jgi:hypothetical protein
MGPCMPAGACAGLGNGLGALLEFCMDPGATCPIN